MAKLSIIIPSFNTKEMTLGLLNSLRELKDTEIIVIDNGSSDGSVGAFREVGEVRVIENNRNLGFAKANNQGIKKASGKYLLLLNSDTIVDPKVIVLMIQFIEAKPKAGAVGCQLRNSDGTIQPSGGFLPNLLNSFFWMFFLDDLPLLKDLFPAFHIESKKYYEKSHELGWVTGAFFLTKKEVVEKVGLLDEKMFMYMEEVDWCQRAKAKGYQVFFNASCSIVHLRRASPRKDDFEILQGYQGIKYFFQKHKPVWQYLVLRIFLKIGAMARVLLFGIILRDSCAKKIYEKAFRSV